MTEHAAVNGTTLFIDGLDVALQAQPGLDERLGVILGKLHRSHTHRFRVRISVRTGVRCDALLDHVERAFSDSQAEMKIVPLTESDVRRAARSEGISPDDFFKYIRAVLAGPLAAQPPTLTMLFAIWKNQAEKELPLRRNTLYRDGIRRLLDERNRERRNLGGGDDPKFIGSHGIEERMAICGRLAAAMFFSDTHVLDLHRDQEGGSALPVDLVIGGHEPVGTGQVQVNLQGIREVVRTALFRPEGGDRFSFAHPSFAEFLAARFILGRNMKLPQVVSILSAADFYAKLPIARDRVAVASWLAAEREDLYGYLADNDPQVILRAGVASPTVNARMRLARGLLRANAGNKLDLEELHLSGDLALISNRDLYRELVAILSDTNIGENERKFAASLIAYCPNPIDPAPLLPLIREPTEPLELRYAILTALRHTEIGQAREALCDMVSNGLLGDEAAELRNLALLISYPRIISPAEFLSFMPLDGDRNPLSAKGALSIHFFNHLRSEDLSSVLEIASTIVRRPYEDGLEVRNVVYAVGGIAKRAFAHLADHKVAELLARLIISIPDNEDWRPWHYTLHNRGMPKEATQELRRVLLLLIAAHAPSGGVAKTLLEISFLVGEDDIDWLVSQAKEATKTTSQSMLITLAVERARRQKEQTVREILRDLGVDPEMLVSSVATMPANFERWEYPRWYSEKPESEADEDAQTPDTDEGSVFNVLTDLRVRHLQSTTVLRGPSAVVEPQSLLTLAADASSRLVRNDSELCQLVLDSLERFSKRLRGEHGLVRALWNEAKDKATPKGELFLSDLLADHFKTDLIARAIVADREVQVRPRIRDENGQRSDIRIRAFKKVAEGLGRDPVASLIVEVKECDNKDLFTAMEHQLLHRYMKTSDDEAGIYVVGWYVCAAWKSAKVAQKRPVDTIDTLRQKLDRQALELTNDHQRIHSLVIDASL
ncbi:UNVERIFIED_ORG: hypothetical protein GGI66_006195 [Rhizobium esperanzae]